MLLDFRLFVLSFFLFLFSFRFFVAYLVLPLQIELIPVLVCMSSLTLLLIKKYNSSFINNSGIKEIINPFLWFFIVFIISSLINQSNIYEILISFGWTFYGVVFLILVFNSQLADFILLKKVTTLIMIILLIQIPLQILQAFPSPLFIGEHPDHVFGSFGFGGTSMIATFFLALSYLFIMQFLFKKTNLIILLSVVSISVLSSYLASVPYLRFGLLFSPVFFFLIYRLNINQRKTNIITIFSLVTFLVVVVISNIYISKTLESRGRITSFAGTGLLDWDNIRSKMTARQTDDEGLKVGRILGLTLAINSIATKDLKTFLIGYGPGATRSRKSVAFSGAKTENRPIPQINFFGLDKLLIDFGILGFFTFTFILGNIFFNIRKWLIKTNDIYTKQLGSMYLAIIFLFVLTFQYDGGWFSPYQKVIPFWFLTAMIYKLRALSSLTIFPSVKNG